MLKKNKVKARLTKKFNDKSSVCERLEQVIAKCPDKSYMSVFKVIKEFITCEKKRLNQKGPLALSVNDFSKSLGLRIQNLLGKIGKIADKHKFSPQGLSFNLSFVDLISFLEEECQINVDGKKAGIIEYLTINQVHITQAWLSVVMGYLGADNFKEAIKYLESYLDFFVTYYLQEDKLIKEIFLIESIVESLLAIILLLARSIYSQQKYVELGYFCEKIVKWLDDVYVSRSLSLLVNDASSKDDTNDSALTLPSESVTNAVETTQSKDNTELTTASKSDAESEEAIDAKADKQESTWLNESSLMKGKQQVESPSIYHGSKPIALSELFIEKRGKLATGLWLSAARGCLSDGRYDKAKQYLDRFKAIIKKSGYEELSYYSAMALYSAKTNQIDKIKPYLLKAESLLQSVLKTHKKIVGRLLLDTYAELFKSAADKLDHLSALFYAKAILNLYKEIIWHYDKVLSKDENKTEMLDLLKKEILELKNSYTEEIKKWKKELQQTKEKIFAAKITQCEKLLPITITVIDMESFSVKINESKTARFTYMEKYLYENRIAYSYKDGLLHISEFYKLDVDSFVGFFTNSAKKTEQHAVAETTNANNFLPDIQSVCLQKVVKFDSEHVYKKDSKDGSVYKLHGTTVHRQYVCVSPKLLKAIEETKGVDTKKIIKGLFSSCERGLVVSNSKGRKTFVLAGEACKLKDASKKIRFFGHAVAKVKDKNEKEHTLFELDIFDPDHKLNFETASQKRTPQMLK